MDREVVIVFANCSLLSHFILCSVVNLQTVPKMLKTEFTSLHKEKIRV